MEISNGDIFDFHFLKTETVMSLKDKTGRTLNIPLSCPATLGLLYDPCNDLHQAKRGFAFATVNEIVGCSQPPHIVRTTTNSVGAGPLHTVFENEILIIKRVCFGDTPSDHYITAYSLLSSKIITYQ